MRKLAIGLVVALMFTAPAYSWEFEENPDRYPSVALDYSRDKASGSGFQDWYINVPGYFWIHAWGETTIETTSRVVTPSLRLPVSDNLTLNLRASFVSQTMEMTGGPTELTGVVSSGSGYGASARWYFH